MGFFERLKNGLSKTREVLFTPLDRVFGAFTRIDEDLFDELEEVLIMADVGVVQTQRILDQLRERVKKEHLTDPGQAKRALMEILCDSIGPGAPLQLQPSPSVILVIGVNGVGKTTSIGKIAKYLKEQGKQVMIAAADTFRAAAIDQLGVWAQRVGVELIAHAQGTDPASVVYDGIAALKQRGADVLLIDTAGRLHNKKNLMDELAKINRVIGKELPQASRDTLLVLDATTGQNAVIQAKQFKEAADITGLVLTKLDGTAKGGIVFSIKEELNIPVKFIGVGEQADDLQPFDHAQFVQALLQTPEKGGKSDGTEETRE